MSRQSTSEVAEDRADPQPAGDPELHRGAEEAHALDPAGGPGEDGPATTAMPTPNPATARPMTRPAKPGVTAKITLPTAQRSGREDHRAHDREALGHQRRQHGARHRESEQQRAGQQTDRCQGDIEIAAQVADHRAGRENS